MELNGVKMLPTSLVSCFVNEIEVRILEISCEGFSFRTPNRLELIESIQLNYLVFQESRYEPVILNDYKVMEETKKPFYYKYIVACEETAYKKYTSYIIRDYTEYVQLKLSGDDSFCSQEKVNYPAELDFDYYQVFSEQKKDWLSKTKYADTSTTHILNQVELAISMDRPYLYEQYLKMDMISYVKKYFEENNLLHHPLAQKKVQRIYIGNEFCHNLFPKRQQLVKILDKAKQENINVTLAFTYMRDSLIKSTEELLDDIYTWCINNDSKVEVVVNDWGMLHMLKDKIDYLEFTLGVLLNKHRKDPRYAYKSGYAEHMDQLSKNNLNGEEYREFLSKKWNIKRYEYESCGYRLNIPTTHNSLHFPFYQTNTSQYCTLYAKCETMERGNQRLATQCPEYCKDFIFAYPKHLRMIGRYNSLFGFDDRLLNEVEELEYYVKHGIDRLVLNV